MYTIKMTNNPDNNEIPAKNHSNMYLEIAVVNTINLRRNHQ